MQGVWSSLWRRAGSKLACLRFTNRIKNKKKLEAVVLKLVYAPFPDRKSTLSQHFRFMLISYRATNAVAIVLFTVIPGIAATMYLALYYANVFAYFTAMITSCVNLFAFLFLLLLQCTYVLGGSP